MGFRRLAAERLNGELETLGAEQQRLERQARAVADERPNAAMTPLQVEAQLRVLFDEFSRALQGDEGTLRAHATSFAP